VSIGRCRQDRQTADRYTTLSSIDAASVIIITIVSISLSSFNTQRHDAHDV